MLMIILICALLSGTNPLLRSQDPSIDVSHSESTWRRFTGKDEEFSVAMPGNPSLYINLITTRLGTRRVERVYSSYSKGSVYIVASYDGNSVKETLDSFKAHHLHQGEISFEADIGEGNRVKQYKLKLGEVTGTMQIHVTKRHGYAVAIVQGVDDRALREFFLSSFSIKGADANSLKVPVQVPQVTLSYIPESDDPKAFSGYNVSRKAVVVSKPEPVYSEVASRAGVTGKVVLRAVLTSSGEVTKIRVIRGLPRGLTESAVEAARHLKFIPAVKDGRFVSFHVQLEYNFGLY